MRLFPLLLLALLFGCPASVSLDGSDESFDPVQSATWFAIEHDDGLFHQIVLTSVPGFCSKMESFLPSAAERIEAWIDDGAGCDEGEALFEALAEESEDYYTLDDSYAHLTFFDGNQLGDAPSSGTYEAREADGYNLRMGWYSQNPYAEQGNNADDACGLGLVTWAAVVLQHDPWRTERFADEGTDMSVTVDGDTVEGEAAGTLVDEDGDADGEFELSYTAGKCEIDYEGAGPFALP